MKEFLVNRRILAVFAVTALMVGVLMGCEHGQRESTGSTSAEDGDGSASSSSATAGEDRFAFEGEGSDDEPVESEKVELAGTYKAMWEISNNEFEGGSDGHFDVYLIRASDDYEYRITPYDSVTEDSGTKDLEELKPGDYYLTGLSVSGSQWKVVLERTT